MGVPRVIIHFCLGFSLLKKPSSYWGTPTFWPLSPRSNSDRLRTLFFRERLAKEGRSMKICTGGRDFHRDMIDIW